MRQIGYCRKQMLKEERALRHEVRSQGSAWPVRAYFCERCQAWHVRDLRKVVAA